MRNLRLEVLTAAAFAPFGEVIDAARACERRLINEGRTLRHHALARIECPGEDARAGISLFRAQPVTAGFELRGLERHLYGTQAFINVSGNRYAIVVAPPGDLDERAIRGFLAAPDQSISYYRGTWHHYLLALDAPSDFVVVDRIDGRDNCDERTLAEPVVLELGP